MPAAPVQDTDIARIFRAEYGRAVSVLVRAFGDIDLAEDAVQDAFTEAVRRWPAAGLAQPGRLDHHHRPEPGHRPAAPGGDPGRPGTPRRPGCTGLAQTRPARIRLRRNPCRTNGCG